MGSIPDSRLANAKISPLECFENQLTPIKRFFPNDNQNCSKLAISRFEKQFEYKKIFAEELKIYPNIFYFDPFKYLCDSENCFFVRDEKLLYADKDHLNINGSQYLKQFMNFD